MLFLRVENKHSIWTLGQVTNSAEVLLQLFQFSAEQQGFLFRHGFKLTRDLHALVFLHLGDTLGNCFEVGQHATEPAFVDIRHPALFGIATHGVLRLLLRANEQHGATLGREFADEVVCNLSSLQRLLEINDVNPVALTENEALHFRVPTTGLVAKVNSGLQHLARGNNGHNLLLSCGCGAVPPAPKRPQVWRHCT